MLVQCLYRCHERGELSNSQKQAVITLIEKRGEDARLIKSWRHISLLNVDVKILSKIIVNRIKHISPNIIHYDQTAFVEGIHIEEPI